MRMRNTEKPAGGVCCCNGEEEKEEEEEEASGLNEWGKSMFHVWVWDLREREVSFTCSRKTVQGPISRR